MIMIRKWIWLFPLAITVLGYLIILLILNAGFSKQCLGFRVVFICILLSLVAGIVSVFSVGFVKTRHKMLKIGVTVLGSLLSLPLSLPVILALAGVHAGDTVCTMAASSEKPQPLEIIQNDPTPPYNGSERPPGPSWPQMDCSIYGPKAKLYPNCK